MRKDAGNPLTKRYLSAALILTLAGGTAIVSSGCGWFGGRGSDAIALSGNIELTEVTISFKVAGKLIERTVDEGEFVKKGTVIARLDQQELLKRRDSAQAALTAAESRLVQLRTSVQYQDENVSGQIERSQAELRQAQAGLAALVAGSRAQEIEQARAAVEAAKTEYDRAKNDWDRAQTLFKNEDISAQQYDQYRMRYETGEASLKQAKEHFDMVKEGPRKEDIDAGRAQVERARANARLADASRLELKRMREELQSRAADVDQARAQLAVIDTQLNDTVVVTPIDGMVLSKSAEPGEVLAAGSAVVTIGDIDRPWMRAYVNETDLGRVKLGDTVEVKTDSFPNKTYKGRISFIASEAEFTPKQIQTKEERIKLVYRIKVEVANPNRELKLNMPAEALIAQNRS